MTTPTQQPDRVHELKCWPEPFAAILNGSKRHEVRKNDRGFKVGDVLRLCEWEPSPSNHICSVCRATMSRYEDFEESQHDGCGGLVVKVDDLGYSGRSLRVRVTHLTPGGSWGLPADLCVMSIEPVAGTGGAVEPGPHAPLTVQEAIAPQTIEFLSGPDWVQLRGREYRFRHVRATGWSSWRYASPADIKRWHAATCRIVRREDAERDPASRGFQADINTEVRP